MEPDPDTYLPDPTYLRKLVEDTGLSQRQCAKRLGVPERQFRSYLAGKALAPYPVQYALEALARSSAP